MAIECDERERWQNYTQIINREEQSKIKEKSKREDHFYFLFFKQALARVPKRSSNIALGSQ